MRCLSNAKGQTTVEVAIVFSLVLLLGLGISEVARAFLDIHKLTQSAREGARIASLTPSVNSDASMQRIKSKIEKVLVAMGKDPEDVTIKIQPMDLGNDGIPDIVDVTVEESFDQIAPVSLFPGMRDLTLHTTISMPLFMPQERAS